MKRMSGSYGAENLRELHIDRFLGLDLQDASSRRDPARSPDGVNMIRDVPGKLRKRMGYYKAAQFPARINGLHPFASAQGQQLLVHAGDTLWLGDTPLYSGMADALSQSFQLGGRLYIADGLCLLAYNGERVFPAADEAYVPTVTVSRSAEGGGSFYEPLNLLCSRFCDSFLADGSSTVYQLSYAGLDDSAVCVQLLGEDGAWSDMPADGFTADRLTGQVRFAAAPAAGTDGADNLRITAGKTFAAHRAMIDRCRFGILFGVNGEPNRLFLSGNPDYPNRDWHSELGSALYFPQSGYAELGQGSAVTAYSMTGNCLAAHKRGDPDGRNIVLRSGVMEDGRAAFPIVNSLQGPGTSGAYSVAYPADEPLFLTDSGIMAITTSDIKGERYAQSRGYRIANRLCAEQNAQTAQAAAWRGFYLLAVNGRCWVLDTEQKSAAAAEPYSAHQYEAFLFDSIPARVLRAVGQQLCFGTEAGEVMTFYTDPADPESYQDCGRPIHAHWDLDLSGNAFYKNKRLRRLSLRLAPFDNSSLSVMLRRQGVWQPLFEETQRLRRLSFDSIDFDSFSFSCDAFPISLSRRVLSGRLDAARLRLQNEGLRQPMGLYELSLLYGEGGIHRR
ncbi:MAG: hypothetical protein IJP01_01080 [Oscillospiraceae bacterium]|nr:hypothetical protein [Oscillospiraceae bacterium]